MLPGKLCIGILEEDNPLKSYFRLKPLLVEIDGKYTPFDGGDSYPEEGCIRIVPDKNESGHFKARMRRMGRYCVLDLREHAGENDKIRPNKNYHGDDSERNAHIVYSDVVREPAADMIFEILPADWCGEAIQTPRVLKGTGLETWVCAGAGDEACLNMDGAALAEEEIQRFEIAGFAGETLRLAIRLPKWMDSVTGTAARETMKEEAPAPAAEPPRAREKEEVEKPWISHDLPRPAAVHNRNMTPAQQALAAQSGLNPRRNRSLQEIIEEKWRHSRVDQLGHPVPANAMGQPVENPLEHALEALRSAWRIPEIHDRLIDAIAEMQEFAARLDNRRRELTDSALHRELEELEAERLKTLNEIDRLRREKAALRETFKQEIRAEEAQALREAVEKTRAARQEQQKYETAAREARAAAEFAQDAFAALNDGRFEEKLREFALTSRAVELLRQAECPPKNCALPSEDAPDAKGWIDRLRRAFAAEGLEMEETDAANLLVCAALGDSLLISGSASSDKCAVGRALARAMGAVDSGCYREIGGGRRPERTADEAAQDCALPRVTLVRDANCAPGADVSCGLLNGEGNRLVISVLSDGGFPVSAEALERGFMLRLEPIGAQAPWKGEIAPVGEFTPVRMQALRDALVMPRAELPAGLEPRLQKLRDALALHGVHISRHTLNLMWDYCAAMLSLGMASAADVLDRAFAQKALPCILAEAPVECLMELRSLLAGMPRSLALLDASLPILI